LRRGLAAACVAVALLAPSTATAATGGPALLEPVAISASAPQAAVAGTPFALQVAVEAEAGALGIAAAPLRVRVKLAPECGGSFAGTAGPTAFEAPLPVPVPTGAYFQTFTGQVTEGGTGTETVCAFLEDAQERQFATDTEAQVEVVAGTGGSSAAGRQCQGATQRMHVLGRNLKPIAKRIAKAKHHLRHAHGKAHKKLARKLRKLRKQKRRLAKQHRVVTETVQAACP
jgi:hypothetical protein